MNGIPRTRTRPGKGSGFTLLEIMVVMTILAVVVGAAVPVTSKVVISKARKATREELSALAMAAQNYFRDVQALPRNIADLIVDPGNGRAPNWAGPYLPGVVTDELSGKTGYQVDAWSRAYRTNRKGDLFTITSMGEDAQFGTDRDLSLTTDVSWIRREWTLERLGILNQAIQAYNGRYLASDPLPGNFRAAHRKLVARGLLPATREYIVDGWGKRFESDPRGKSPMVRAQSISISNR